jgi:WD40 repeat protein
MIVDEKSSILDYPQEIRIPLAKDHRGVARFSSKHDPCYVKIRDVLKGLVDRFAYRRLPGQESELNRTFQTLLAMKTLPEDDHLYFQHQRMPGSCEWILEDAKFVSWFKDCSMKPRVIWLYGVPGCGKSILTSYIVDHIRDEYSFPCQFVYLRAPDGSKRSINYLLRSLAYQAACQFPEFGRGLDRLHQLSSELDLVMWNELFCKRFLKIQFERPFYWIIDALDEITTSSPLLSLIGQLQASQIPIRIMFISCYSRDLSDEFKKLASKVQLDSKEILGNGKDIARFVAEELHSIGFEEETTSRQEVIDEVLQLAQGSFLWVGLVVKEIQQCHTKGGIHRVLKSLSSSLIQRYLRISEDLKLNWRDGEQELARLLLTWVVFSKFSLTVKALSRAVEPQFGKLLDPMFSLSKVCSNLIKIDSETRVTLVHHTVGEYLTTLPVDKPFLSSRPSHILLLQRCLEVLSDSGLKLLEGLVAPDSLLFYAMTSWPDHLTAIGPTIDRNTLHLLMAFLQTESVLSWICILSRNFELPRLVHASKALNAIIHNEDDPKMEQLLDSMRPEDILKLWAIDFLKIHARFSECLLRHPTSIYRRLPPFCPTESAVSKLYVKITRKQNMLPLSVAGLNNRNWDDSLNRLVVDREHQARKVLCKDQYFAVLTASLDGSVRVFHTRDSRKGQRIKHNERVVAIQFSNSGHMLATYGLRTTKVWVIETAQEVCAFDNPKGARVLAIGFEAGDQSLLFCSNEGVVRRASLCDHAQGWQILESVLEEDDSLDGSNSKAPSCAAFNADCTLLAVAYKGWPISIWNISVPKLLGTIGSNNSEYFAGSDVTQIGWNAIYGHVFGTYKNGTIFKCHPNNLEEVQEFSTDAEIVRCSPTGTFLVSSSESAYLNIWNFEDFSLLYRIPRTSTINDIAISSSGKRIYDLEEFYCNISDPNTIIHLAEPDDSAIGSLTEYSTPTDILHAQKIFTEKGSRIESFAVGQKSSSYCIGYRNGALGIFQGNGSRILNVPATDLPIEHMIWSPDEQYLVVADTSTRFHVKIINKQNCEVRTIFEKRVGDPIQQILFHKLANMFLVATQNSIKVYCLQGNPPKTNHLILDKHYQWINHPKEEGYIIGFGLQDIRVFCWDDLASGYVLRISTTQPPLEPMGTIVRQPDSVHNATELKASARIKKVLVSGDGSVICLQIFHSSSHGVSQEFMIVQTSSINSLDRTDTAVINAIRLPRDLEESIDRPLGFVSAAAFSRSRQRPRHDMQSFDSRLTFINKEGWLCSMIIDSTSQIQDVKVHIFLSQDWLNTENLEMAHVTSDGRLFWPKNDEVAIISNSFIPE